MVKSLIFFVAAAVYCSAQTPTVTCNSSTAQEGQAIACTSSSPVTWSLASGSVGTLSNQKSTSVTYTAPASIIPQNSIYSVPALPDDTIFNTTIDNLPVNANSSTWLGVFTGGTGVYWAWGFTKADNSTPTGVIKEYYGSNVVSNNFVLPNIPKRENGTYHSAADGNDHHQIAVRYTDGTFWEIYNRLIPGVDFPPYLEPTCSDGVSTQCNAVSAVYYPWSNYSIVGGTDAAGLPIAPLTINPNDVYNGLKHVTRFSTGTYIIDHDSNLWPAVGVGNGSGIPYGARLRLRLCNGSSITTNCVTASNYSALAQNILNGWHSYGLINADAQQGDYITFTASAECQFDPSVQAAINSVGGIPPADFEVVDESSLQLNPGSIQTCPYNTTCNGTANTFQQPAHQAILVATPTGSGSAVSTAIALQGVAIGLDYSMLYVLLGTSGYQIPTWVGGTTNQNVTWTLVSGVGSVTAGGVYTAPTTMSGGSSAVLKVTAAADPNATAYEYVTILPTSSNPSGTLRIDVGGGGQTDGNGNVWIADTAHEPTSGYVMLYGDYPAWFNANANMNPEISVYESAGYTFGGDLVYHFVVPNGNYKVRLMFGSPYNGAPYFYTTAPNQYSGRMDLEAQWAIGAHNFDYLMNNPPGYLRTTGVPSDTYIPAAVTNNTLEVAARGVFFSTDGPIYPNCGGCYIPALNGLEIIPDTTPAHWTIDTQQTVNISPGSTLQLYAIDWYTGLSDAQWSILSGPGSISSSGLYTAPTMQPSAGTAIVIQAQSASKPSISATATLMLTGTGVDIK